MTELNAYYFHPLGWTAKPCEHYLSATDWELTHGFRRTKDGWPLSSFEPTGSDQ